MTTARWSASSHLLRMADAAPGGEARVPASGTPAALSMAIRALGERLGAGRRLSAYDVGHQRCVDAWIAFQGDLE